MMACSTWSARNADTGMQAVSPDNYNALPSGLSGELMETKLLNDDITAQVKEIFGQLVEPVEVLFFGSKDNCEYCDDTLQLVKEITDLDEKLSLSIYDIESDKDVAQAYRVDKTPGLVIAGRDDGQLIDYGIRMAGIPAGHEFGSLVHDLMLVSSRDPGLSDETRAFLKNLSEPVFLQVFVTPT
jgi:glutaredoxin-like protein